MLCRIIKWGDFVMDQFKMINLKSATSLTKIIQLLLRFREQCTKRRGSSRAAHGKRVPAAEINSRCQQE
ncbi:hypothetical protein A33I_02260 [Alkalihalophilus marmarensis DSM 21297]|uniref:Uncharacterized protein n=1 Tax=Alkalihalophilus marmarensis DSM 21297 TaxID=1188261 RepID=U6SIK9_9BACI|nr:hypothetical protein A33I_02260 [Alkalihalophilus marmarensis DSM 21297]